MPNADDTFDAFCSMLTHNRHDGSALAHHHRLHALAMIDGLEQAFCPEGRPVRRIELPGGKIVEVSTIKPSKIRWNWRAIEGAQDLDFGVIKEQEE